jgi:protein-disulfide isomerase
MGLPALGAAQDAEAPASEPQLSEPEAERTVLDELIRDYILNHPEVILESLQRYEQRLAEEERQKQQEALQSLLPDLQYDEDSPVLGNPEGDVVLVEFFDYRCPYCKRVAPAIEQLISEDPNLRVVMKEWPILSEVSRLAARAALAADRQGLYREFHLAVMTLNGELTEETLFQTAEEVGLDVDQLRADMDAPEILEEINDVYQQAQKVGATGTPAFVIGDQFYGGAIPIQTMRQAIAVAREKQG